MGTQKQFTKVKIRDSCRINCQQYIAIIINIIILVHTKNDLWVWFVLAKTVYGIVNKTGFLLVFLYSGEWLNIALRYITEHWTVN